MTTAQVLKKAFGDVSFMAGTEGTGQYVVLAATSWGRVGVRNLGGGSFRVRVEPTELGKNVSLPVESWKQPGEQNRFSRVAYSHELAVMFALEGLAALGKGCAKSIVFEGAQSFMAPCNRKELREFLRERGGKPSILLGRRELVEQLFAL